MVPIFYNSILFFYEIMFFLLKEIHIYDSKDNLIITKGEYNEKYNENDDDFVDHSLWGVSGMGFLTRDGA